MRTATRLRSILAAPPLVMAIHSATKGSLQVSKAKRLMAFLFVYIQAFPFQSVGGHDDI